MNHKDEYSQMTTWLKRRKKIQCHMANIRWQQKSDQTCEHIKPTGPPLAHIYLIKMTQHPSVKAVSFDDLAQKYGVIKFQDALGNFITAYKSMTGTAATI